MNRISSFLFLLAMLIFSCQERNHTNHSQEESSARIITAGGTITEIVVALGFQNQIIATDKTSTFPSEMQELPSIGYRNQIKAEGILALSPTLILAEEGYLNEEVVDQLKNTGIEIRFFSKPTSIEGSKNIITEIASFLDKEEEGKKLVWQIELDIEELNNYLNQSNASPSAAFVMARGPETLFIAGENTFAENMFRLADIQSASTGFEEFIPLTPEALVSINPDYLVFFESGIQSLGGVKQLGKIQGIGETKAFQNGQIIQMDGHFLSGFGPRVGKAAMELAKSVRP